MSALPILTWHSIDESGSVISITPELFSEQIAAIANAGFRGITLIEALSHRERYREWPSKSVVLTFDDGYENFATVALPVMVRHGFSATVFLISGHIGGINDWGPPPDGLGRQKMMTWQQVREAADAGMEPGAHTVTHPDLRELGSAEAKAEITGSRSEIEDQIGCEVRTFAYPFGYRSRTSDNIVRSGFAAACTTDLRRAGFESLHELPRLDVYYLQSIDRFIRAIEGRLDGYLAIRRWGRSVKSIVPV